MSHIALLEHVVDAFPSERLLLVEDNLSTHHSRQTQAALLAWPDVRLPFIPTYGAWLNLIEPWWKVLRSLALKGRRFESWADIERAITAATAYWNAHRHPFTWGHRRRHRPRRRSGVACLPAA